MVGDSHLPEPLTPDLRPRGWGETNAAYLARSTMPYAIEFRGWIRESLTLVPAAAEADVLARLRGRDDKVRSVVWELACARVLTALGYGLEWHPELPNEKTTHPDFLVRRGGTDLFYFEARVIEEEPDPEEARILDELNTVHSPDFWFIPVKVAARGEGAASTRRLRQFVQAQLAGLVWSEADAASIHRTAWVHDGWIVEIGFKAKGDAQRGCALDRPVGMHMGTIYECSVAEQLRKQIKKKISKYGRLDLPLVVGARVVDMAHDEHEILSALLGTAVYTFRPESDGGGGRTPDGLLRGPAGVQSRRLSALLIASRLNVVAAESSLVKIWYHPEPHAELDRALLPFASTSWDRGTGEKRDEPGVADWDDLMRRPLGRGT